MLCGEASCSDVFWSSADGLQIVARRWTVPNPRGSVLVLHGIGDHGGRFEHVANHLNLAGYNVLAPDMRGHGRSAGTRGYIRDFTTLAGDVDLALGQSVATCSSRPAFVYGQSFGGLLAIFHALRQRPRIHGLIASSPALRVAMSVPRWKVVVGQSLRTVLPRFGLRSGLDLEELSDDPQVACRARSDRYRHDRITPGTWFGMLETGVWCLNQARQLECPALLMHGDVDRITDHGASIEFATDCPHGEVKIWPGGKHELHNMSNQQEVLDFVTDFQNRCIP